MKRAKLCGTVFLCMTIGMGCSGDKESDNAELDAAIDGSNRSSEGGAYQSEIDSHIPLKDSTLQSDSSDKEEKPDAGTDAAISIDASQTDDARTDTLLPTCGEFGDSCSSDETCCSHFCDPSTSTCVAKMAKCAEGGADCDLPTECCSLICADGTCQDSSCLSDGDNCSDDYQCCSTTCTDGTCDSLNLECKTAGNSCTSSEECCSNYCKDEICQLAASFCIQEGDICGRPEDCCTGSCEISDGKDIGICGPPPDASAFCNDGVEGSVCGACNDCCSRLCAPYAPTGVLICQPASGCHVTGDFCRQDTDCCGASGSGLPGDGNVTCQKEPGSDLGICRNPTGCSPQGNVCHYKDYVCGVSSARANCCDGTGAKSGVCQLDLLGIPRCTGLGDECRQPGETCSSAVDCCNDLPCIPDQDGILRCMIPQDGGPVCVETDGSCTISADCCTGLICIRPIGSTRGTCGTFDIPPPDGGVPDAGGTPDGGTTPCSQYGQSCDDQQACCNDIPCDNGICRIPIG